MFIFLFHVEDKIKLTTVIITYFSIYYFFQFIIMLYFTEHRKLHILGNKKK